MMLPPRLSDMDNEGAQMRPSFLSQIPHDDLRAFRAPSLANYFGPRDVVWLCVIAILVLELVLR